MRFAFFHYWQREVRIGAVWGFYHKVLCEVSETLISVFLPDPRIIEYLVDLHGLAVAENQFVIHLLKKELVLLSEAVQLELELLDDPVVLLVRGRRLREGAPDYLLRGGRDQH